MIYTANPNAQFNSYKKKIEKSISRVLNSKKYTFFDSKRWDLETLDGMIVKLPNKNYDESLKNFLKIKNKNSFKKYLVFDYRIPDQLILK